MFSTGDEARRKRRSGALDSRDVWGAEVHGEEQRLVLGTVLQHPSPGGACLVRQLAEPRVPVRRVDLQGMMHGVAAEQRAFSTIGELEDDVARRMSGRGLDQERVLDGM